MLAPNIAVHELIGYRCSDRVIKEIEIRKTIEEELTERLKFERLMFDLSARFVNLCPDRMESEIQDALQLMLEFFRVDRCALIRIMQDGSHWQIGHIASADGLPHLPVRIDLPVDFYPWTFKSMVERHEVLAFPTLEQMPPEAKIDRRTYEEWGIRSILNVPINFAHIPVDPATDTSEFIPDLFGNGTENIEGIVLFFG